MVWEKNSKLIVLQAVKSMRRPNTTENVPVLPVVLLKRSLSTRETRRVLISWGQVFLMLQTAIVLVKWHWKLVWKVCIILVNLVLQTLSNLILPKKKVEWLINILVKPLIDSFTSDVSNKLDPSHHGGQIDIQWYPISMYSSQGVYDPTNPSYEGLDIHKVIGKLSIPKSGSHFLDISTQDHTTHLTNNWTVTNTWDFWQTN